MRLYYAPGACSLSPHIALREADLPFDLVQVDNRAKKTASGEDYLAINPNGYVPALILDDGQLLTEGAIIVQYIADQKPASRLAPPVGTPERLRLQEWLNFIATELHKSFGPLNNPKANDELKESLKERLALRFQFLAKSLRGKAFISGDGFTVADGYAYYTLRNWRKVAGANFADSPVLAEYFDRIGARPAVKAALATEGLT